MWIQNSLVILWTLTLVRNIMGLSTTDPIVDTRLGLIRGLTSSNGGYSMFMGIPYGVVNEANPFGEAAKYPNFNDVFEAYDDSAMCPQMHTFNRTILGSLDCLKLNVYVPSSATSKNRLPVLIGLYGGAFQRGFGGRFLYGPDYLVRHDVILVTLNYRLGPYGFMCLDIPEVTGNQGLKDQLLAMKWVKENIEAFGGDPNQITIFGQSAGGHSIDLHLLSPKEKLYNKVILQSGCAYGATLLMEPDKAAPLKLAKYLGFPTTNVYEALKFLTNLNSTAVIRATLALGLQFKPCVEKDFDGVDEFITYSWLNVKTPKVANMSVLIGFNEYEMMNSHVNKNFEHFTNLRIFKSYLNKTFNFDENQLNENENLVREFYLGNKSLSGNVTWEVINYDSDFTYIHPVHRTIRKYLESGARDIFYYMFSYNGSRNFAKRLANTSNNGAAHADDLGYLFDMEYMPDAPTSNDQLIIDRMTAMWTNFAKYSDPTPQETELLPLKWMPLTEDQFNFLKIDLELSNGIWPLQERMAFWDGFYETNKELHKSFDGSD